MFFEQMTSRANDRRADDLEAYLIARKHAKLQELILKLNIKFANWRN